MKVLIKIITILTMFWILLGSVVLAVDEEEEETYDITLTDNYNFGDQEITLEWTGVSGSTKLADVAKVGDYVDYPITKEQINENWNALKNINLGTRVQSKTMLKDEETLWRVMYNDGKIVKLVSVGTLCTTTVRGEDFGWYKWKDPYRGSKWGDSGGYGYFYQLDQIAKCFANYDYVTNMRSVDITTLYQGTHASRPRRRL